MRSSTVIRNGLDEELAHLLNGWSYQRGNIQLNINKFFYVKNKDETQLSKEEVKTQKIQNSSQKEEVDLIISCGPSSARTEPNR